MVTPDLHGDLCSLVERSTGLFHAEAAAVVQEAIDSNPAAQYIVGSALEQAGCFSDAQLWFKLSADQSYTPATQKIRGFERQKPETPDSV